MSIDLLEPGTSTAAGQRLTVVDCDIHPGFSSPAELHPFMPEQWREYQKTYGGFYRQALSDTLSHPRMAPEVSRADAWPPGGGPPGSNLEFMRKQHLDHHGIAHGMLMPLNRGPGNQRNLEYGAALASAVNDWQIAKWIDPEPRLHGSIVVTQEHTPFALAEIEKRAGDKRFSQIMLPPKSLEPLGRRRYWPIYDAACHYDIPIALHVGGINGYPTTGGGYPSYYIEEQHTNVQGMQGLMTSMVVEGVFEQFPKLKVVLVEGGLAWVPSLKWRLDKHWKRLKSEAPHLKRLPSEYIHDHFWLTTQPLDEPHKDSDLVETFEFIGFDRIMFSTDYPHWDFDEPKFVASKLRVDHEKIARILGGNARELYKLP